MLSALSAQTQTVLLAVAACADLWIICTINYLFKILVEIYNS